ncbi:DUF6624 domain-containing protein [Streptomyces sp. 8L]|uniref:DUF6624 domain-containing protein n=1 Tax=Streptomyces sp. 8L TaxID=2877242 RepID=UPI001CD7F233|nr:DUF6624 domain-containing protein [Streptomyces sp. 8L]MCA1220435.1 hypothetical protein [Streptomyces sp. 8L]
MRETNGTGRTSQAPSPAPACAHPPDATGTTGTADATDMPGGTDVTGATGPDDLCGLDGLARELLDRVAQDSALTATAHRLPGPHARRRLVRCRAANAAALREIVEEHGWPSAALVGAEASTAALMILLHADDLPLQLTGRDLITDAVERGQCSPIHAAYATDHCAVELGRPQPYGTRYTPLGRPFPVADPDGVDARRVSIGLRTMAAERQALADIQLRHLNRASA